MFSNAKFRWFLLAPILLAISVVVNSPVVSLAESLEDAQEQVRLHPNDAKAHHYLGQAYHKAGQLQKAIASYKEAIRIKPDYADSYNNLGNIYIKLFQFQEAIAPYKEAIRIRIKPEDYAYAPHYGLGAAYSGLRQHQKAATEFKEVIRIKPDYAFAHYGLGVAYEDMGRNAEAIAEYREALRIDPNHTYARNNLNKLEQKIADERLAQEQRLLEKERKKHKARKNIKEADKLAQERRLLEEERKKWEDRRLDEESRKHKQEPRVQSAYTGTGFLFSAKDYVITNWHVIRGTKNIQVKFLNGENIKAKVVLKDPQNDIVFLKLEQQPQLPPSDLKIGDSSKVRMGDKVFTIGYPAYWVMGENPKYTEGVVNATSGLKDDPTVFQVSVQIQPGNSGGPLFNSNGEVIGITQASLDPKVAMGTFGTLPQNVNYAIKSSYISNLLPMLPETMIASRGIMVVPTDPQNTLANFIERNVSMILRH
ncbi:MAG: tetratricopeptide repeat protein [Nitrospina sp.]|jgi:S1-C subfamily serine protease|nr:tetratricopeptide repeat protein [Nitrospina sp.]MBT3874779.1 tetratricopeptide repeat protein [Nitrospina sp.]MBT4557112.1 tetratricopeptide repeat protein [Nitrospina sp.]MBT5349784.1 tetratricopeptide repeat protein [Nitrospina sp.]MBT6900683.1 tetratricopeptide repeat protein [Nitrospina sp.]